MRIAVTGSSGRIGRAVVELALLRGHSVVAIDQVAPLLDSATSSSPTFIQADVTDYSAFKDALRDCEALIHLAAIPSPTGHADHEVHNSNVVGSYNALSAATQLGIWRLCLASSINAIGGAYSRAPRYDYLPLDEQHPTYNEDPYSLSKWIGEQQADSFAQRDARLRIASLRFHWVVDNPVLIRRRHDDPDRLPAKHLWGYTRLDAAARACLLALTADFTGHEVFYIVAPETTMDVPSLELKARFFADTPLRGDLDGYRGFFNCEKAERLLGWKHDES